MEQTFTVSFSPLA